MKTHFLLLLVATSLIGAQASGAADTEAAWKIEKLSLVPVKEGVRSLTASILRASDGQSIELSDQVALQEIRDAFVWKDKLVLIGHAERTPVVEIFDLARKVKLDRFVCSSQPRRISDNWIAYTEFYFSEAQGPSVPVEVLLVYDLAKTPLENRLEKEPGQTLPVPISGGSNYLVNVGIPVYPELNARQRSYQMIRETQRAGRFIDGRTLTLLPSKKLIFSCAEMQPGKGWIGAYQYLAVVDLSQGIENPAYRTVDFPKMGEYGTTIEKIEAVSPTTVRLVFPKGEYAVNEMVVTLPVF